MERAVIVVHRKFDRWNASSSVWLSQEEREFRDSQSPFRIPELR